MKTKVQGVQFQVTLEHANRVHHRCLTMAHTCYTVIENALERGRQRRMWEEPAGLEPGRGQSVVRTP